MNLSIAICDDSRIDLRTAGKLVKTCLEKENISYQAGYFSSAAQLLSDISDKGYNPDIAVLDIEMSGEDGISLAKKLNQLVPECRIIFFTGYIEYASDVYETEHIWFVIKKTADHYFPSAMKKALLSLNSAHEEKPYIIVKQKGTSTIVPIDQICFISKVGRKAYVSCIDREYYDTRRPALLIPEQYAGYFIHCHQGYWVNVQMLRELDHDSFILKNGKTVPISRSRKEEARKRFFEKYRLTDH